MASYPQMVEYNEVIQHPATAFTDPELQKGRVKENALGLPVVRSGGFALTYTITTPQKQLAVRCFHREIPGADQKYAAISQKVESLKSRYFVGFNYLARGIKVRQAAFPIVKMAWVEGDPLGVWLDKNSGNASLVEKVRGEFAALASFLNQNGIAHGDINNENVMVSSSGITLIDYDGMYVPGMPTGRGTETGHKHFQHTSRDPSHFGSMMDRFSFIAVDLSLRAITQDSSLHKRFREGGETIVFRANDFADPQSSEIFQILRQKPQLSTFTGNFATICVSDIRAVPTLEDFLAGRNIPASRPLSSRPAADVAGPQARITQYIGAYPVLSTGDYAGVTRVVGQRIELVGRIHAVKHGMGRRGRGRGKPWVFVNFGPWRGDIVKLTIWSEGLAQLQDWPDDNWVGRWVSVVGLVDPPYAGKHYNFNYTHVGITIENPQQINIISENEAKFRLGQIAFSRTARPIDPDTSIPMPRAAARRSGSNRKIIDGIARPNGTRPTASAVRQGQTQGTSNQDILRRIQQPTTIQVPPPRTIAASPSVPAPPRRTTGPLSPPVPPEPTLLRRMLRLFGLSR